MSLQTIYQTLAAQGGTVTLDDASLGTTGLNALLASCGLPAGIQVTLSGALQPPNGSLAFAGTSGFLGGSAGFLASPFPVQATITDGAGGTALEVDVTLPSGWTLGDSFYPFTGGPFDATVIQAPALAFRYNTGAPGLILSAQFSAVGPLQQLAYFVNVPSPATLQGPIALTADGPTCKLEASLGTVKSAFDTITLTNGLYRLALTYEDSPYDDPDGPARLPIVLNQFEATCGTIQGHTIQMVADLGAGTNTSLVFQGDPADAANQVQNQGAIVKLFPEGSGFPGNLMTALFGDLSPGLKSIGVSGSVTDFRVDSIFGTIGLTKPWMPVSTLPQVQVTALDLDWTYAYRPSGHLFGTVSAELAIADYIFDIEVDIDTKAFAGRWRGGVALSLADINDKMLTAYSQEVPQNPDLDSIQFSDFGIAVDPAAKTFELSVVTAMNLTLSEVSVDVTSMWITIGYTWGDASAWSFALDGLFAVNNWQFQIKAQIRSSGWSFSGRLMQPQTVVVSDVVDQLLGGNVISPDDFSLSATIETFSVAIDTGKKSFDLSGAVSWQLTVAGTNVPGKFGIALQSLDSMKTWSGGVAGQITVADMTFAVGYQWSSTMLLLTGAWSKGSYDWGSAIRAFGAEKPDLPVPVPSGQTPDIKPDDSLVLSYDFKTKVFTLVGQAAFQNAGLSGFLTIVPASQTKSSSTGFAAGVQFQFQPGFFGSLSSNLKMFDDFGISGTLALAIANFDSPDFKLPIEGQAAFPGIRKGFTFYGQFDWLKADPTTRQAIGTLTGSTSALDILIGFYKTDDGWEFKFAGALTDLAVSLGDNAKLEQVSLALTASQTSSGFDFKVLFDIAVSVRPGSGYIVVDGKHVPAVLELDGQLGFEATSAGGAGGFAAAFMKGAWYEPGDFSGLVVGNLGLLLGVAVQKGVPVPSFGLTGFLSYNPTHDIDFEAFLAVYFDGADPKSSLFIGSMKEVKLLQFAEMMLWAAAGVEMPSLLQSALSSYGIRQISLDLSGVTVKLTEADYDELDRNQVPDSFFALAKAVGQPIEKPLTSKDKPSTTLVVVRLEPEGESRTWYVADFRTGRIFQLLRPTKDEAYTLAMLPWLYVVPKTTTLGSRIYQEGYGFGGELELGKDFTLDIVAELAPKVGLSVDAVAPHPIKYPLPIGPITLPTLLTITARSDTDKGPRLSLSTYQKGDIAPHFDLDARVVLLGIAEAHATVRILSSGLSFQIGLDALGIVKGALDCLVDKEKGFAASTDFSIVLEVDTKAVEIDGVEVIPPIHIPATGFGLGLSASFPLSSSSPIPAAFSGSIFFVWADQRFEASISFTLDDLNNLVSTIKDWVVDNIGKLLKNLLEDFVQWAKALANKLFELTAEAAAKALKALGAFADDAAKLLAEIGYGLKEVYDAIKAIFALDTQELIFAITQAFRFDIGYAAITQRIGPPDAATAGDVTKLIGWMRSTAAPAFAAGSWGSLERPGSGLTALFSASLFKRISVEIALSDPGLHALHFVSADLGLDLILPYQKLSDSRGVFAGTVPSSTELMDIGFGPFGYRSRTIDIAIYTDGSFVIDYGYPEGGDWSRSAALVTPMFSGQGGFRLSGLPPGTTLPGSWAPVSFACQIDAAMRLQLGASLSIGILSGGWWMSFDGGFTAMAGYGHGIVDPKKPVTFDPGQPTEFKGTLYLGFSAGIYGSVDFGIVSASVHVSLSGRIGLGLSTGQQSVSLAVSANVSVGVGIRINLGFIHFTISFSFSMDVTIGPPPLPWQTSNLRLLAAPEPLPPLRFAAPRPLLMTTAAPTLSLNLLFLPELTIAYDGGGAGAPQVVLNLAAPYTHGDPNCDFNNLVRALLEWALSHDGEGPVSMAIPRARLERLERRLKAKPRLSRLYAGLDDPETQLDYATLVGFLKQSFKAVTVSAPTADGSAVTFPMIPDLVVAGGVSQDFSTYNPQPPAYEDAIEQAFARFKLFSGGQNPPPLMAETDATASLATYVFVAYFEYLLQGATNEALQKTKGLNVITPEQWVALSFDQTAAGITTSFRGGVQLPTSAVAGAPTAPIYVLTGQQLPLTIAKAPVQIDLTVAPGANGGWIAVQNGKASFTPDNLSRVTGLSGVKAPLTLALPPALSQSLANYPFATLAPAALASGAAAILAAVPAALAAAAASAPCPVTLWTGTPNQPAPLPFAVQWGTLLSLTIRRVPGPDGKPSDQVFGLAGVKPGQMGKLAELIQYSSGHAVDLSLLLPAAAGGYIKAKAAAAEIVLLRTNLSTESRPPDLMLAMAAETPPPTSATLAHAADALAIVAAYGQTNAPGYYLALQTPDPAIAALFGTGSTASLALLAARGAPSSASPTQAMASDDTLVVVGAVTQLYAQATDLYAYQPTSSPGVLPIVVTRPDPDTADPKDSAQQWLDKLYNLFSVAVSGTGYADLGFAPAASPATVGQLWQYTLALPLTNLLSGGPNPDPYAAIGTSPEIAVQLRDCFGNPLGTNIAPFAAPQLYTDALVGPGSWIGTTLSWVPGPGAGQLQVTLDADKSALDTNKSAALPLYRQASWQFSRPGDVQFVIASSLDTGSGMVLDSATQQAIAAYVSGIMAYLSGQAGAPPQPVTVTFTATQPTSAVPPVVASATLSLRRIANVDTAAAALLPSIARTDAPVSSDLSQGLSSFAQAFQAAFPALRLGTGASASDRGVLWAVAAALVQPAVAGAPTYFAPAPLYTSLQAGTVDVPQYGGFDQGSNWPTTPKAFAAVDADQLLETTFGIIDSLLLGPFAAAAYAANLTGYNALVEGRSTIAKNYSANQLSWLFKKQAEQAHFNPKDPTLWGARAAFSDALQDALANAYAIDGVLAFGTTWSGLASGWAGEGLSLWGMVRGTDATTAIQPSSAKLKLTGTTTPAATLYYDFRPGNLSAEAHLSLHLEYVVTHVAVGDLPGAAPTWIALVVPQTAAIGGGGAVEVPVVNRFFPTTPTLKVQSANPTTPANPSFDQLFRWTYAAEAVLQPVAQDIATATITYNVPPAHRLAAFAASRLTMAEALVRFQGGYAQIAPVLGNVTSGASNAGNIVAALADLVTALQGSSILGLSPDLTAAPPVSSTLAIKLAAEQGETATWLLKVTPGGALPGTLSALPMTIDGQPQPNVMVVQQDPLIVSYQPVDPNAPVLVQVSLEALDLRTVQSAQTAMLVTRNAQLLPGLDTVDRYVLTTPKVAFPQAVAPSIAGPADGYDIATLVSAPASGSLADWLAALFEASIGTAPNPRLAIGLGYSFPQYTGQNGSGVTVTPAVIQPVLMTGTVDVDNGHGGDATPAVLAQALAGPFTTWARQNPLRMADGAVTVDLTLLAAQGAPSPGLLHAPDLHLVLSKVTGLPD